MIRQIAGFFTPILKNPENPVKNSVPMFLGSI
jgi:hypothetical protein